MITEERKKRYAEKLDYSLSSLERTDLWLDHFKKEKNEETLFAAYKAFQELVESLADILAMFLKDKDLVIRDDYTNIDSLKDKNFLNETEAKILTEANGLRNRIIHKYNGVNVETFIDSVKPLLGSLSNIIKKFKELVKNE